MTSIVSNELGLESKKKLWESIVLRHKSEWVRVGGWWKELIEETIKELNKEENSFIITYNGDNFDFAYLKERAKKTK